MKNLTDAEIAGIPALKAKGYTTSDIAKLYGKHKTSISYWYKRLEEAGHTIVSDRMGRPPKKLEVVTETPNSQEVTINREYKNK